MRCQTVRAELNRTLVSSPAKQNRTLVRRPIKVGRVVGSTLDWLGLLRWWGGHGGLGLGQQALGVPFQQLLQVDGMVRVAAVTSEQAIHEPA